MLINMTGKTLQFLGICLFVAFVSSKEYCQPDDDSCWPSQDEIDFFEVSLDPPTSECLENFPTFTSADHRGAPVYNQW